jgi:hypothetical protein
MKLHRSLLRFFLSGTAALAPMAAPAAKLTVLGDSLTKEYRILFPGVNLPPLVQIPGLDPTNPNARNWAEILDERRHAHFDSGTLRSSVFNPWTDLRLLGHECNWAVPGATARAISLMLTNPNAPELAADPDFTTITNLAPDWKLTPQRLTTQLASVPAGAVIWAGGNDLRFGNADPAASFAGKPISYETIYLGDGTGAGNPQPLMDSIASSIRTAALFVRAANPSLPIAICAVPHVGCTPEVRTLWPTDPVRTGRITSALAALNSSLKTWTENTLGGVWVDTFSLTTQLITSTIHIGGVPFRNESDTVTEPEPAAAHNRFLFSHDGFHPITPLHAVVAQSVQAALAARFPATYASSPPITDREIITSILGLPLSTGYDEFMTASAVPANQRHPLDDPDRDGLSNLMEFCLANHHPMLPSGQTQPLPTATGNTATLSWTPRFPSNVFASLTPQMSTNLSSWSDVPANQVSALPDGSLSVSLPIAQGNPIFLRLKASVTP